MPFSLPLKTQGERVSKRIMITLPILTVILSHCIMHVVPSCRRRAREGKGNPPAGRLHPSPFTLHPCASPRRAQRHSTRGVQYLLRTVAQYAARPVKNIAFHARHEGRTMPMLMHQRAVKRALASLSALCYLYSLCLSSQWTTPVWRTGVPPPDRFSRALALTEQAPHFVRGERASCEKVDLLFLLASWYSINAGQPRWKPCRGTLVSFPLGQIVIFWRKVCTCTAVTALARVPMSTVLGTLSTPRGPNFSTLLRHRRHAQPPSLVLPGMISGALFFIPCR